MASPLFTIIIPSFNVASKLRVTLDSILAQKAELYEIVVIDGASTDGTVELLASYGERIRWRSEADRGVYDAMNKAVPMAQGRFLYFIGAGDTMRPGALEVAANAIQARSDKKPIFVYASAWNCGKKEWFAGRYSHWRLSRANICHQAIFYDKRVFNLVGLYDERYKVAGDWVLNMRIFSGREIARVYIADLVIADFEGGGLSDNVTDHVYMANRIALIKQYLGLMPYLGNKLIARLPKWMKPKRH